MTPGGQGRAGLLALVTGGNELAFKVRRPLFSVVVRFAARGNPGLAGRAGDPRVRRIMCVTTAAIGVILLVHAQVMVALALTTSTTTFLALSRALSLAEWPETS